MDYKKIGFNTLGAFAAAFCTAMASGSTWKVAATLGFGAVIMNLAGLFQNHPNEGSSV